MSKTHVGLRVLLSAVLCLSAARAMPQTGAARTQEPIAPLSEAHDVDPAKAGLGAKLFADPRLSGDQSVSCQSCHLPNHGGADPRRHSTSAYGKVRELNSPSIFNVRYNTVGLNWTGRTANLEAQITGSIPNADTMANSWTKVLASLASDASLVTAFSAVYGDAPFASPKAVMDAIVSYERSLVTPSRFDDWLRGNERALSHAERIGYQRFKEIGCTGCHNGVNVGGNSFAKLGLFGDYFADRAARGRGALNELDKGRILTTKNPADLHVFRVAPLRNVALTAPYFHDGSVQSLDEAILLMGRFQLGRELSPVDRSLIAAFLGSLSGKRFEQR